jgi:diguanylate cyclase (GGDEF)-like protein
LSTFLKKIFKISSENIKKEKKAVYKTDYSWDEDFINSNITLCRAYRTSSEVYSTEFYKICESCYCENEEMICLPFVINDNYSLLLHIRCDSRETVEIIKESIAIIKNYFDIAQPVLESKLLMNILKDSSLKDALTGLYNRRYLDEFVDDIHGTNKSFSILMVDIDYFKQINDKYGHDMGDKVLKGISEVLRSNIKGSDLAIRFGGEEFLIMLFNITPENALKKADEIRIEFSKKIFKSENENFSKTLSIGIAHYPTQGTSIWHSIKYADVALYEAKNSGRNKVIEFKEDMFQQEQY